MYRVTRIDPEISEAGQARSRGIPEAGAAVHQMGRTAQEDAARVEQAEQAEAATQTLARQALA